VFPIAPPCRSATAEDIGPWRSTLIATPAPSASPSGDRIRHPPALVDHDWPGNARTENAIEHAVIIEDGSVLCP
jgi:transcriptional regulator with PAS, ATPase and Fis domain